MKLGDIVVAVKPFQLASGSGRYPCAVVVQESPLVLSSVEGDMVWTATLYDGCVQSTGSLGDKELKRLLKVANVRNNIQKNKNDKLNLKIDINDLKAKTQAAIQEGLDKKHKKEELERIAKENHEKEEELRAQSILALVPGVCAKAAAASASKAKVLSLSYSDVEIKGSGMPDQLSVDNLRRLSATIVYNACKDASLNPTIEYWHDGCGMNSGYDLYVNW